MKLEKSVQTAVVISALSFLMITAAAENSPVSLGVEVSPKFAVGIGAESDYYTTGYGVKVSGLVDYHRLGWLSPRIDLSYDYLPVDVEESTVLSLYRLSVGPQATLSLGDRFSLFSYAAAGGYYGTLQGAASAQDGQVSLHAGGGVGFQLFNDIVLSLHGDYDGFLGTSDFVGFSMGINSRVAGDGGGAVPVRVLKSAPGSNLPASGFIGIDRVELTTVFPVLMNYYDSVPVGSARIRNRGSAVLKNIEVRLIPSAYIDSPKLSARIEQLKPGEERLIDLYALFNESILNVSEGAKVVTDVVVEYSVLGRSGRDSETVTLNSFDRNALTWDDDRKIAAFVTAKDDEIQRFAKYMASLASEYEIDAVSEELRKGMLQFQALQAQELTYVVDPGSSYETFSRNSNKIDYVQFPRQTLYVKAGDCDDLSASYCALLESVGVETAFITVPGHIFTAFKLNMTPAEVRREISAHRDLIEIDGTVWLPVETTLLSEGFIRAWSEGAREWRRWNEKGEAALFSTRAAWAQYAPVAFSISDIELGIPDRSRVQNAYIAELTAYIDREIGPREERLLSRLGQRPGDPQIRNALGVLYGRYGRYEDARLSFEQAVSGQRYLPALLNLGNIFYLTGDFTSAAAQYQAVLEQDDQSSVAWLGLARTEHERENFGSAKAAYRRLAALDRQLAERYAYLDPDTEQNETSRAADAVEMRMKVVWEEE